MSENRYQEALDRRKEEFENLFNVLEIEKNNVFYEDIEILQELISKQINFVNNQLTKQEIEAILICMSYYSLRNEGKLVNNIDVGFGGELYSKLKQLSGVNDNE